MSTESRKRLFWVGIFGIAMGWFEAAVVIYLRTLYYPEGFAFPVKVIPTNLAVVELGREAATILMLIAVGWLAGRTSTEKFGYFIYAFGIWDIVYYIGLYLALGWPESLLTWDILFLIPLPWIGPVLAPILVSLGMIFSCFVIVSQEDRDKPVKPSKLFWWLEILCGLIIIGSFIIDFRLVTDGGVPTRFHWEIFLLGFIPGILLFLLTWKKSNTESNT